MFRRKKRKIKTIFWCLVVLSLWKLTNTLDDFTYDQTKEISSIVSLTQNSDISLDSVVLKRVVDGDTLIVTNADGEDLRVRLIGIDTPESVNPDSSKNTIEGELASEHTKSLLTVGQQLYLEYDIEKFDIYNRTLAYVWLSDDVDASNIQIISTQMLNAKLVADGYAIAKQYAPNIKYATIFESLEH